MIQSAQVLQPPNNILIVLKVMFKNIDQNQRSMTLEALLSYTLLTASTRLT